MDPVLDAEEMLMQIAHDMRQPLNFVSGMLDLCIAGRFGALEPATSGALNDIRTALDEAVQLLADGCDSVRVDNGKKTLKRQAMAAGKFLDDLASRIRMRSPDQEVIVEADPDVRIAVDPGFLERSISRLILSEIRKLGAAATVRLGAQFTKNTVAISIGIEPVDPAGSRPPATKVPLSVIFCRTVAVSLGGTFEEAAGVAPCWELRLPSAEGAAA